MVGTFLVLAEANQLSARNDYWHNIGDSKIDLARYLGAIQHGRGFGTLAGTPKDPQGVFGGSEDTIAILCAEANHISQYAYCPVEFEKVLPIPPGYVFAVGVSGVPSQKDGDAGNKCRLAVEYASALIALWQRETGRDDPHLAAALNGFPDAAARWTAILKTADCGPFDRAALSARLEHFMLESGEIIPEAGNALAGGDLRTFGRLVDRSQQIAEQLLGTQTPETNFLVASARRHDAVAASAFGMGVGGSVWALVEIAHADAMLEAWANDYRAAFPHHAERAEFFITHAGPAAVRVC
jgi:galactokinase